MATTDATTTITMDSDKSVVANFSTAAVTYTLIIEVTGEGLTEPEPGPHAYAAGTVVTINATPDDGWEFANWTGDSAEDQAAIADGDSAATTVTMNGNHIITANFQETGGDGGPANVPLIAGAIVAALAAAGGFFFFLLGKRRKKKKKAGANA
ncbi:MAG: hypothetical protein FJZ95_03530 [Chloroflexi bacterium]|nr:hypothetical protein [Chloroflexota bacterium]